ncbi:hypothetical protein BO99DRAFT_218487 [Aspergillus violaceofuscus CBS 115571]|uniref:Uncharacterized protein n=1 Tax=Aspergillus violaceofuscus (strain CBS 115571) TaxID=1450538 RepID=A0A2V5IA43_ASPV1|nr:hypothetical protein BO99DRAFT_218487 [Aspergillus violaceofuscus CBS 115571]
MSTQSDTQPLVVNPYAFSRRTTRRATKMLDGSKSDRSEKGGRGERRGGQPVTPASFTCMDCWGALVEMSLDQVVDYGRILQGMTNTVIVVPELSPPPLPLSLVAHGHGFHRRTAQYNPLLGIEHHLLGGCSAGMEATQTTKQNSCCSLTFWAWQPRLGWISWRD